LAIALSVFSGMTLLITSLLSSNDSIKHFDNHDNDLLPLTTMIENKLFVISFFADLQVSLHLVLLMLEISY
jgi:hypothetical protein